MAVLEALAPRGLVNIGTKILKGQVSSEGLIKLLFEWEADRFTRIEVVDTPTTSIEKIILPRLIEPHAHLDKAFTINRAPNPTGSYQGALEANLQEQKSRSFEDIENRASKAIRLALKNGLRAIRSHVDSFGPARDITWEALLSVKSHFKQPFDLQLVAMTPIDYWKSHNGREFAGSIAAVKGLLGGVLLPPFNASLMQEDLAQMIRLADSLGCGIDIHVDESQVQPAVGLKLLLKVLDDLKIDIPITCSHLSSMALLPEDELKCLADRVAQKQISVVALPTTNCWLLGHDSWATPLRRPLAPIKQLQQAGVLLAVGGDNVQDPWFPGGNFDPVALMGTSLPLTQLAPWERLGLAPFTTAAARLMALDWDGTFQVGGPAEFLLLEAGSLAEAISTPPQRQVLVCGSWV